MLRSACVAFCALFLVISAARAADPGTLTSKTKAAEITVTFDVAARALDAVDRSRLLGMIEPVLAEAR